MICTPHQISFGCKSEKNDDWGMWHKWRKCEYEDFVRKPERQRILERYRQIWKRNMKMDLKDVGWGNGLDRSSTG
jgi:hypothetical protein